MVQTTFFFFWNFLVCISCFMYLDILCYFFANNYLICLWSFIIGSLGIIAEKSQNRHAAQCLWDSLKYRYCHSWTFSSGIICLMIGYANILLSWNTVCLEKGEDLEEKLEWTLRSEGRKHSIPGEEGDFFYNACGLYSWYFLHLWIARCS